MSPPDIERLAATLVPGSGELELLRLSAGLNSATYRVRRAGRLYALKVSSAAAPAPRFELAVLNSAAAAGVAPRLIACDPAGRMLVLEWLQGTAMSEAAARHPDAKFAALLNAVHALPLPARPRLMSVRAWTAHYDAALAEAGAERLSEFAARAEVKLRTLEAAEAPKLCICHSDLHRLNVLVRAAPAGSLALLDWEYAHVSEALWDLAGWSANNDLDAHRQSALLAAYYGRRPTLEEAERLGLLFWLYDYVCLQWIKLYVTHQGQAHASFGARTALLQGRLRAPSMAQSPSQRICDL